MGETLAMTEAAATPERARRVPNLILSLRCGIMGELPVKTWFSISRKILIWLKTTQPSFRRRDS